MRIANLYGLTWKSVTLPDTEKHMNEREREYAWHGERNFGGRGMRGE